MSLDSDQGQPMCKRERRERPGVSSSRFGPDDTDPDAERFLLESMRRLSVRRKAEMVSAASQAAQKMALAGLRSRYPGAGDEELRLRLAALRLDRETMIRLCGWDPEVKGY
jgi:hypothetical protein